MRTKLKVALHYQILIALALGGFYGYFFHSATPYTNWVGEVFLRGLNMVIVPLILTSIITGVASLGSADNLGRLGIKTMGYYVLTTLAAIVTGYLLVEAIKPGVGADLGFMTPVEGIPAATEGFGKTLI